MSDVNSRQIVRSSILYLVVGVLVVVGSLVLVVTLSASRKASLLEEAKSRIAGVTAGRRVQVVSASPSPITRSITLVGEARPYATVTLYSKVSGFLSEIRVDRGDKVSAGEVLAIVDSPELDQQYEAAVEDARNKRSDAGRARVLVESGSIALQNEERTVTAARVAEANAEALKTQKEYQIIRAPFAGTVTARYSDPGALVQSAANAQTTALPIVTLSQIDRLRVYAYPDQHTAGLVRLGDLAEIWDAAQPDVKLAGTVTRTSGELDPKTRTLLVEIDVDNSEHGILAGSWVQVTLSVKNPQSVDVPAGALIFRKDKPFVGVITQDNKVALRPVSLYDSDGKIVRVSSGLQAGERVGLHLGDGVADGDRVQPIEKPS
jgi:membrane fusion protein (multidrug efflux system)